MNIRQINRLIKKSKPDIDLSGQTWTMFDIADEIQLHIIYLPQVEDPQLVCLRGIVALCDDEKAMDSLIETNYASFQLMENYPEHEGYIFTTRLDSAASKVANCALYCGVNWIELPLSFLIEKSDPPSRW
jgi:hypothetical protein